MNISLYRNTSPRNKAVKKLTLLESISGTLKDSSSIVDPIIMIHYETLPNFNYFEIPMFNNRKYFLTDLISVGTKLWEIHGHCDVLSSFWAETKECDCIISRSTSNRNDFLIDTQLMTTAKNRYGLIPSQYQPLKNYESATRRYVLVVAGAGSPDTPTT